MAKRKKIYYRGGRVGAIGLPLLLDSGYTREEKLKSNKRIYNSSFLSPFAKAAPKNLLVMYDIPHEQKKERDWFRRHLIKFGYIMIQKSVWVGPSPIPKDFLAYVKEIGIEKNFKTFKLSKPYTGKL